MNDTRSTPARLTTTATAKLPRTVLIGMSVLYILAGLFFRDPWKTDDVVGLATMLTALQQAEGSWLAPHIGALAFVQSGPLATWAGALSIWLFSPAIGWLLPAVDAGIVASRLPNLLWFGLMTGGLWYGTYLLGRRPEPQPLALPFGGEPSSRDYGRMIADAALLLFVATVGILWRVHETSAVPVAMACQALAFYSVARLGDHPRSGALTLAAALAGAFLAAGLPVGLPILLAVLCCCLPGQPLWPRRGWVMLAIVLAAALLTVWWWTVRTADPYWASRWWLWNQQAFSLPRYAVLISVARDLLWFLWPTWPFALLALWHWRAWWRAPHIWVPLMFLLWPLVAMVFQRDVFEPEYSLLAVPTAILAAFALPTLRRGVVNSLDWFAVMCFTLTCLTVWLGWIALQTGWPEQIAHNIARQTRGYDVFISWPATAIALAGTAGWLLLVRWRLAHRPAALWRGTVLSAGGLFTTWLLLVTLWMPALDYVRSYRDVSAELAAALRTHAGEGQCVRALGVGMGQRASFLVFEDIDFGYEVDCPLVLQQTSPHAVRTGQAGFDEARVLWEGKRGADRHEMFRLLQISGS